MAIEKLRGVLLRGPSDMRPATKRSDGAPVHPFSRRARAYRTPLKAIRASARTHTAGGAQVSLKHLNLGSVSRRTLLQVGASLAGGTALPMFAMPAFAVGVGDKPPIGTWPTGQEGDTVNVAAAVPRTGSYAGEGEDRLEGWQAASGD